MSTTGLWMLCLTLVLCAMILAAAAGLPLAHMTLAALINAALALSAIREDRRLKATGANESAIASSAARFMSLVWLLGAAGLALTYVFILQWKEWWHFFLAFAAVGGLCLFFAMALAKDARAGREDATMLKLARYLNIGQFAGMLITVAGLLIDGKMTRYLTPRYTDWAGNNFFFFGALALAAISAHTLWAGRSNTDAKATGA